MGGKSLRKAMSSMPEVMGLMQGGVTKPILVTNITTIG